MHNDSHKKLLTKFKAEYTKRRLRSTFFNHCRFKPFFGYTIEEDTLSNRKALPCNRKPNLCAHLNGDGKIFCKRLEERRRKGKGGFRPRELIFQTRDFFANLGTTGASLLSKLLVTQTLNFLKVSCTESTCTTTTMPHPLNSSSFVKGSYEVKAKVAYN
ncbi:hypothetical protein H5410_017288 [Solanum commersonii]|uniref:Uncharacterized protein n=1 Tax=Solanum commersonii TaxID=4109 RepID=A0A9J5ZZ08_SOLCO|nr:hypothetical protein H5410_017288 [Solanum commersonii]